jgi:GNAT superfamily N-acetyltransferase
MGDARAVIRHARQSDAEGIARVHIASGEESFAPIACEWPALDLDRHTKHWAALLQTADRLNMVATVADQVVGFISGGPSRKPDIPASVEVYVFHLFPTHRGAGIGGQLWDLACTTLRGPAHAPLYLQTIAGLPCCTFYDARGGEVLTRTAGTFYGGAVTYLAYYWSSGKPHQPRR